jgi:hypothetical protein
MGLISDTLWNFIIPLDGCDSDDTKHVGSVLNDFQRWGYF